MPNEGFMRQLQVFEQCEHAPAETHPVYIAWKKSLDEAIAKSQVKFINIIPVVDNIIYLSRYMGP
jgi:dual specificity phosphatase 12